MNKTRVYVLIEGYAREIEGGWLASSTVTLIETEGIKVVVDPGVNRARLLDEMTKRNISISDIDYVFMTHYHPDQNLLVGMFEHAVVIDDELLYENDKQVEHNRIIPGTGIKILSTPGHEDFHGSLLVDTKEGKTVVAGDVFWWADEEKQIIEADELLSHKDPFVKDGKKLRSSREMILETADWVIPGHGKKFKVSG